MIDLSRRPLVETDWLAAHLSEEALRVVDARWRGDGSSRRLYQRGHIPGAVPLDWQMDLSHRSGPLHYLILPPERFAAVMAEAGIGDETRVVAYADLDYSGAARLWWALRYYGHDQVSVLNGGLDKWVAEGRPLSTDAPRPRKARFTPRPRPEWLATAAEIEHALRSTVPRTRLLDTRPPEQFSGWAVWAPEGSLYLPPGADRVEVEGRPLRAGRIPGAVHLPSSQNLDPADWRFLNPQALRARAQALGLSSEQRVITYCGVGISAALGLLALYLAGYRDLALYDGSWEEWGMDPNRPLERDPTP